MSGSPSGPSRRVGEEGAVAIVVAVLLPVLILMAAYVLDLAGLRADRTSSQVTADMAAAAGVIDFDPVVPGSAAAACDVAKDFASSNLPGNIADPLVTVRSCLAAYPASSVCPGGPFSGPAVFTRGRYVIEVIYPVPDGHELMGTQGIVTAIDGDACERLGVRVQADRDYLFAPIAGNFGGQTAMSAVARSFLDPREEEYASLIVLQRNGCQTLENSGGGQIRVFDLIRDEPDENGNMVERRYPGTITVDTLPSGCSGGKKIIEARTSTGALVEATGRIVAHALLNGDGGNTSTYPEAALTTNLRPRPEAGPIITRSPVDYIYNCKKGGYPAGQTWSPQRAGQPIEACPDEGPDVAYIETLKNGLSPIDSGAAALAAGWSVYPDGAQTCAGASATLTPATVGSTRLYVDCSVGSGSDQFGPTDLRLEGFSHVIFREGISVGNNERLAITGNPSTGTLVYLPRKGVNQSGGELLLRDVFTYVDAPTGATSGQDNERFRSSGSTERFALQAPLDETGCSTVAGVPNAACFAPLALWSNSPSENELAGNGNGGVIGSMFTPNAKFKLRGSALASEAPCTGTVTWSQIAGNTGSSFNLESAQFFASQIDTAGGAAIRMCPNPETGVPVPLRSSGLIR
jgi:hypothetical protein